MSTVPQQPVGPDPNPSRVGPVGIRDFGRSPATPELDPITSTRSEQVRHALKKLQIIEIGLGVCCFGVLGSLGLAVISQALAVTAYATNPLAPPTLLFSPRTLLFVSLAAVSVGLPALAIWDSGRREGMAIYQEISDEYEWLHRARSKKRGPGINPSRGASAEPAKEPMPTGRPEQVSTGGRPTLEVRIRLRRYLNAASLPFAPADWAGPFYFTLFFVEFLVSLGLLLWLGRAVGPNFSAF